MDELKKLREKIDAVDHAMVECFEKRISLIKKVAEYKIKNHMPVLDASRENIVLKKRAAQLKDPLLSQDLERLFQLLMQISREQQKLLIYANRTLPWKDVDTDCVVAFQGEEGANSERALKLFFGEQVDTQNYPEFADVFEAVQTGETAFGVIPIENSYTGSIVTAYDLLNTYDVHIVGEQLIPIDHNLLGVSGSTLDDISDVYSHEQALKQCEQFLKSMYFKQHPYYNTAVSAHYVAEQNDYSKAAIASRYAGELYGLTILKENISATAENTTRFIIIGNEIQEDAEANKASVHFVLEHKSGALAKALKLFSDYQLNMNKIESRPLPNRNFEYSFFVDFEGDNIATGLDEILLKHDKPFESFTVLGLYRADKETI